MSKRQRDAAGASAAPAAGAGGGYPSGANAAAAEAARRRSKEEQTILRLSKEGPENADTKDFCGAFASIDLDNSWDMANFKKGFGIEITKLSAEKVTFDMFGIDPPLVNAFRRILIAEVPTVAISRATIYQNTGVIHDENLAHRLGLVPLVFEPDLLKWRASGDDFDEDNSLLFTLHAVCNQDHLSVYSGDLKWQPMSEAQEARFKDTPPRPVVDDILIARLRSGQEIEIECHCEKGIGRDHAKWSPVCTAAYKLLPLIRLPQDIKGADAEKLKASCPMGVFDIEDLGGGNKRAVVAAPRKCTTCRECISTFDGEKHGLILAKKKDHYLFSIESVGQVPATELFDRALKRFAQKCETAKTVLQQHQA